MVADDGFLEKIIETYRGLLEFGAGELSDAHLERLARPDAELAQYFATVTEGSQQSVYLNESLTVVGRWVLSGEHGVENSVVREQLQAVVRAHLQKVQREAQAQRVQEERVREVRATTWMLGDGRSQVSSAFWVGAGAQMLVSDHSGKVQLWDLNSRQARTLIDGQDGTPYLQLLSGENRFMLYFNFTLSGGGRLGVGSWEDAASFQELRARLPSGVGIIGIRPSPSGKRALVLAARPEADGRSRHFVLELAVDGTRPAKLLSEGLSQGVEVVWSPDELNVAVVSEEEELGRRLQVFNRFGESYLTVPSIPIWAPPGEISFAGPDHSLIVTTGTRSGDGQVSVYDLQTGKRIVLPGADELRVVIASDPVWRHRAGELVAALQTAPGDVVLWDIVSQKTTLRIQSATPGVSVKSTLLSPSERYLAIAYDDDSVVVWDVEKRELVSRIPAAEGHFLLSFSPDEQSLAVRRSRSGLRIWHWSELD